MKERWETVKRVLVPTSFLACIPFMPIIAYGMHDVLPRVVSNTLFFLPQTFLFPYSRYYKMISKYQWGENPFGIDGVISSVLHWVIIIGFCVYFGRRLSAKKYYALVGGVGLASIIFLHIILSFAGYNAHLDGP